MSLAATPSLPAAQRIPTLDIVRGFALLGILIMNMPGFSTSFFAEADGSHLWPGRLDQLAEQLRDLLFSGKFNSMFSLLFGIGFTIQFARMQERNPEHATVLYLRRLIVLAVFGLVHATVFWTGDVLHVYAVLGLVLLFGLRRVGDRAVAVLIGVCLLYPAVSGALRLWLVTPEVTAMLVEKAKLFEASNNAAYGHGSFLDAAAEHLREFTYFYDNRWSLWGLISFYVQMAMTMLLGLLAGRRAWPQRIPAPKKVIYLEGEKSKAFAAAPTQFMSLIPTVYNADTLGIRPDLIKRPIESWKELLNPEFKGKTAILNIPSIGIMDAAMVVESMGLYKYPDKGNMTKKEIDLTIKTLIEAKKAGQFRSLWKDFNESVNLMASGEVVIQSMWSPAVTAVRSKGIACTFQPLKEGYRAWAAGFGLPATLTGKKLDGAYEFINWFLDGWAGAYLNRQGYYSAVLETAKAKMEPYEWAYWMEGKPAEKDIKSPNGDVLEKAGKIRDGGSYDQRMGGIACWNALMDENTYMVQKWNEFVAA